MPPAELDMELVLLSGKLVWVSASQQGTGESWSRVARGARTLHLKAKLPIFFFFKKTLKLLKKNTCGPGYSHGEWVFVPLTDVKHCSDSEYFKTLVWGTATINSRPRLEGEGLTAPFYSAPTLLIILTSRNTVLRK